MCQNKEKAHFYIERNQIFTSKMRALLSVCVMAGLLSATALAGHGSCYRAPEQPVPEKVLTPRSHMVVDVNAMPRNYDWRNASGVNYCTSARNQHIPQYCGSCWAMASSSSFADRIRIARGNVFPDYMIAVQTLVYCLCTGCDGGDASTVYQYINEHGVGADTCQNYVAKGLGTECSDLHRCENCQSNSAGSDSSFSTSSASGPNGGCYPITDFPTFYASEYGTVLGVEEMKAEIFARGPIPCYVDANPIYHWGFTKNSSQVFTAGANHTTIDHVISVVGFGYDSVQNVDYWIIRNSWGEYWGQNGYFRLKMGEDQLGIETTACAWAVPLIPDSIMKPQL